MAPPPSLTETPLFASGSAGYHTYRIPALTRTNAGTILAFCEGRKHASGDAGKIDLLLKRSFDHGVTWAPPQLVVSDHDMTCGNPCPVVDATTGTIWLPFCKNLGDGPESMIIAGKAPRTVWLTHSTDDGASWAAPVNITDSAKDPAWTWYATGPGHGIQLHTGRLVIPCDHIVGVNHHHQDPYHSHVLVSDDHGITWHLGGSVPDGTNECCVVETIDHRLYINCRNYKGEKRRAIAWSDDGGDSFSNFVWEDTLIEPICQGSMVRLSQVGKGDVNRVLFANPASTTRQNLTVRLSHDECQTWAISKTLYAGPAAYSDLAVAADGTILCLYERGIEHPYETLTLARFNLAWLC